MWYSSDWNASLIPFLFISGWWCYRRTGLQMLVALVSIGFMWFSSAMPFVHFENTQCRSSLDNFCLHSMPSTWSDTCFFYLWCFKPKTYQRIFNVPGEGVKIFSPPYLVRLHLISFLCFFIDFHLIILRQTAINQKGIHYEVKSFWSINQSFFPRWYESYHWC